MKRKSYLLMTGFLIVLCSCNSIPKNNEKITVNGMIYDTENRPAVNYRIYLNDKYLAVTDIGGRFSINNVRYGSYKFSGSGSGYLSMEDTVEIYDKSQILYIKVPSVEAKFEDAYTYLNQHKYSQAETSIQEILDTDEKNPTALYFMCVIEYLKGDIELSKEYKDKLVNNGENTDYVRKLEKIISSN